MSQERLKRITEEIKREVGRIIHDEVRDPRIGFITITKVNLSPDLHVAKVYFSILGDNKQLRDTEIGLERSKGFIRRLLGQRVKIRYTPEIVFKLDENIAYGVHISEILDKIKQNGKKNGHQESN